MRITFLTPHTDVSGGVKRIMTLCNLLQERGHKVCLVAATGRNPNWFNLKCEFMRVKGFVEKHMPDADIIVCPADGPGDTVIKYDISKGKKYLLVLHYAYHNHTKEDINIRAPFIKLVTSEWLKRVCEEMDPKGKTYKISFGIDPKCFYPYENKTANKNKVIGILHHIYEWKGFDDGIKAFKIVKARYPQVKFVSFGCHGKPLCGDVPIKFYFNPSQAELVKIYNECDIWVCPSWKEGLGSPSIEAMACKLALVTTDNGGSSEYAFHEKTALVSSPKDYKALALNIIRLIEDEVLFKKIAEGGYKFIQNFTWEKCINKVEKIFKDSIS